MSFNSRLSSTRLAILTNQFVVVDSIEKLFQIKINHPAVACYNILLCLGYRLMSRSLRSEPVAVSGECRVPLALQDLHHRLLDESLEHSWNAAPPSGFGISTRLTGLGL